MPEYIITAALIGLMMTSWIWIGWIKPETIRAAQFTAVVVLWIIADELREVACRICRRG